MKNMILLIALPFILGCTATAQTTPSKQPKTNRVETFSQLDSTEPVERPNWLQVVPESDEGFYFVGMSTKRTEKRNARNESFNDALIGFARYCGLNVQYLSEHRDTSMGGNGGLIDTFSKGNTIAKMQAEMLLGNVATKDRYTEKYSSFYGGSFMGHTFVDATLIYVPKTEMNLCKKNRKQANTFLTQKTNKIKKLETENKLLKNQNVALTQAKNSSTFFKQVLNTSKVVNKTPEKLVSNNKPKANTCNIVCNNLVGFYLFNSDVKDLSSFKNHGRNNGAKFITDQNRKSILLDGKDDFVIFKDFTTNNGDIDSDSFSISIFVKFPSLSNKWVTRGGHKFAMNHIIGSNTSFLDLGYLSLPDGHGNLKFGTRSTKWQSVYVGHTNPLSFQHIVAVASKQDKKISIYVNGTLRGTTDWDGLNVTSNDLMLGKRGSGRKGGMLAGYANIIVDELRIYNKALTKNEVDLLYQGVSTENELISQGNFIDIYNYDVYNYNAEAYITSL